MAACSDMGFVHRGSDFSRSGAIGHGCGLRHEYRDRAYIANVDGRLCFLPFQPYTAGRKSQIRHGKRLRVSIALYAVKPQLSGQYSCALRLCLRFTICARPV